jgi:TolB protein
VFLMNAEGRNVRRVTRWIRASLASIEPTWSPDGHRIAYIDSRVRSGAGDIFVLDLRRHKITNLTRTPEENETSPAWSPDGRKIAYESDRTNFVHLDVMRANGSQRRRLTRGREIGLSRPNWSPDSSCLLFSHGPGGNWLAVIEANGSGERLLVKADDLSRPSWSPDARRIVFSTFTRSPDRLAQIYVMRANGTGIRQLTHSRDGRNIEPDWQPLK